MRFTKHNNVVYVTAETAAETAAMQLKIAAGITLFRSTAYEVHASVDQKTGLPRPNRFVLFPAGEVCAEDDFS